ncbi:hypothetical protein EXN66_Car001155 [Channa argus]|uniref:Uncharacterized protein n=1 Tax=Channa argus TaxID=215402 RepID=A0A6G1QZA9_CHAAH|nr:hypothetical protein EXN66_Car001155 [Channa argus]
MLLFIHTYTTIVVAAGQGAHLTHREQLVVQCLAQRTLRHVARRDKYSNH